MPPAAGQPSGAPDAAASPLRRLFRRRPAPRPKIKKLPPELRRPRIDYGSEPNPFRRLLLRLRHDSQFLRSTVQMAFILLCVWIGVEFYLFVTWAESGGTAGFTSRPPGAEGFLPISALISLTYWLRTGFLNDVHPSGLFIFVAIVAMGWLLKKSFCSWMCPVGTISESLWKLGQKVFGRNLGVNRWIDYPLRSLKYLLLLFFAWSVFAMDAESLKQFIYSPYNKMADVKMYYFFAQISGFALWTILILIGLSVVIKNFWCRYLCPYGALLGAMSWFSPLKIERKASSCIDCELCTKACPAAIRVHSAKRVISDECSGCLECVEVCPVKDTLGMKAAHSDRYARNWAFGLLVVGVFVAITGMAMLADLWQNGMSKEEYLFRFKNLDSPLYEHARGQVPKYGPND
jgi:polyferredoxin